MSPTYTKKNAIAHVIIVPLVGSLVFFFPFESHWSIFLDGKMLSFHNACRVLGATIIEPRAEEMAAHAKPIGIIGPQIAISLITN